MQPMESFFALLQGERLGPAPMDTRKQLRIAVVTWIDGPTTADAAKPLLAKLTPIEFEAIMTTPASQAS